MFLTKDEFRIRRDAFTEHYQPLVQFLVASGARFSEATALTPQDIDRQVGTVRIWRSWKHVPGGDYELGAPKTSRSVRTINVPLSVPETLDYSREWLFLNGHDNPVRIYGWRENVWYPAVEKARARGLKKKPRVHDLSPASAKRGRRAAGAAGGAAARLTPVLVSGRIAQWGWRSSQEARRAPRVA